TRTGQNERSYISAHELVLDLRHSVWGFAGHAGPTGDLRGIQLSRWHDTEWALDRNRLCWHLADQSRLCEQRTGQRSDGGIDELRNVIYDRQPTDDDRQRRAVVPPV